MAAKLREANLIVADVLDQLEAAAKPGMTTWELNEIADRRLKQLKAESAFARGAPEIVDSTLGWRFPHPTLIADGHTAGRRADRAARAASVRDPRSRAPRLRGD